MNKNLKLSIFFTALWAFMLFVLFPLSIYFIGMIPVGVSIKFPFLITIWEWSFYAILYGSFLIVGLAIITGVMASRETIKAKSKWASVALILALANALYLFGVIYASL